MVGQAWRCIGDAKEDIYEGTSGKWFPTDHIGRRADLNQTQNWDKNPPTLNATYIIKQEDGQSHSLVPLKDDTEPKPSLVDQLCTGKNDTEQTTMYYNATNDIAEGKTPERFGCIQKGAVPIIMQNITSWQERGCNLGFQCMSVLGLEPRMMANFLRRAQ